MVSLQKLEFAGKKIRTVIHNGEVWFVACDVGAVLGIVGGSLRNFVQKMPLDEHMTCEEIQKRSARVITSDIKNNAVLVSEPGLYRLIMRSKTPDARKFQDWIYKEVIPSIRRANKYELTPQESAGNELPARIESPDSKHPTQNESADSTAEPQTRSTSFLYEPEFRLAHEMEMNVTVRTRRAFMRVETTFFDGAEDSLVMRMRDAMEQLTDALQTNISKEIPALPAK